MVLNHLSHPFEGVTAQMHREHVVSDRPLNPPVPLLDAGVGHSASMKSRCGDVPGLGSAGAGAALKAAPLAPATARMGR